MPASERLQALNADREPQTDRDPQPTPDPPEPDEQDPEEQDIPEADPVAGAALAADVPAALELLRAGTLTLHGRLTDASNAALYCSVTLDGVSALCVYKPVRGERPLWDFPDGTLAGREVAAYEVAAATGWALIPPTVLREGPFGTGMVQIWVEPDPKAAPLLALQDPSGPEAGWLPIIEAEVGRAAPRCWCTWTTSGCAGSRWSTRCSTTPTARAVTCCRPPTDGSTGSTTVSPSRSPASCAPCSGVGPGSR